MSFRTHIRRAGALGTLLTAGAATAAAQGPVGAVGAVNPFGFGVSAGAAVPTGDLGDFASTGFSVDGVVTLRVPTLPVSFRGEVGYTRFGFKDVDDANLRFISGVANVVFSFPAVPTAVVRPYIIGGVGAYNGKIGGDAFEDEDEELTESSTEFGFNVGAGIEIPLSGLTGFGEVRFTSVRGDGESANFIPIRFGIRF
jgi:opacity protein-like surface antigen